MGSMLLLAVLGLSIVAGFYLLSTCLRPYRREDIHLPLPKGGFKESGIYLRYLQNSAHIMWQKAAAQYPEAVATYCDESGYAMPPLHLEDNQRLTASTTIEGGVAFGTLFAHTIHHTNAVVDYVMAHEYAHLLLHYGLSRWVVGLFYAGAFCCLVPLFWFLLYIDGMVPLTAALWVALVALAAALTFFGGRRCLTSYMEYEADLFAVRLCGSGYGMRCLHRYIAPKKVALWRRLTLQTAFASHPLFYKRVVRAHRGFFGIRGLLIKPRVLR